MIKNSFESYPDNENKLFSWEGTHEMKLEKFSRKAPHSWPEIRKQTFFLSRYSGNSAGKIFQKCSSLMTRNQKFWKKSGKIFQETLWVTTRFLEIFSRIWQYGLTWPSLSSNVSEQLCELVEEEDLELVTALVQWDFEDEMEDEDDEHGMFDLKIRFLYV